MSQNLIKLISHIFTWQSEVYVTTTTTQNSDVINRRPVHYSPEHEGRWTVRLFRGHERRGPRLHTRLKSRPSREIRLTSFSSDHLDLVVTTFPGSLWVTRYWSWPVISVFPLSFTFSCLGLLSCLSLSLSLILGTRCLFISFLPFQFILSLWFVLFLVLFLTGLHS